MHSFGMPNVCVELKGLSNTVGDLIALKSDFQGWCCILEHHLCLHVFIPVYLCFLCSGLHGSDAVSQGMVSTLWLVQQGSMPSTSGRKASGTW